MKKLLTNVSNQFPGKLKEAKSILMKETGRNHTNSDVIEKALDFWLLHNREGMETLL